MYSSASDLIEYCIRIELDIVIYHSNGRAKKVDELSTLNLSQFNCLNKIYKNDTVNKG